MTEPRFHFDIEKSDKTKPAEPVMRIYLKRRPSRERMNRYYITGPITEAELDERMNRLIEELQILKKEARSKFREMYRKGQ